MRFGTLLAAGSILSGLTLPAVAAEQMSRAVIAAMPEGPVGSYAAAPVKFTFPLSKFVSTAGPLRLKDSSNEAKIAVPLSARLKATNLQLSLVLTNSIALVAAKSALVVRFNDATLGQIRLDPNSPNAAVKINIPVDLLRAGFNTLSLGVAQHTADQCEDPEAPELWTEIDTSQSSLELTAEYRTGPFRLSDFDAFLAPGIGGIRNLAIVTGATPDPQILGAGALVAQAAALRAQYEPVKVRKMNLADSDWAFHPQLFTTAGGRGGSFILVYDVNGDGRNDVISSYDAHGYGFGWFEQKADGSFAEHKLMGATLEESPVGVKFSQLHAMQLADMNGDGILDVVTGKRRWAHGPLKDDEPNAAPVLYWFEIKRDGKEAQFIPHQIDDNSGVGTQVTPGDVNKDGKMDVVIGNKKGVFVFLQE